VYENELMLQNVSRSFCISFVFNWKVGASFQTDIEIEKARHIFIDRYIPELGIRERPKDMHTQPIRVGSAVLYVYEVVSIISWDWCCHLCSSCCSVMQRKMILLAYLGSQCTKFLATGWTC
jgi:hypothetical protein